jgi:hypothetical protein
VVPRQLAIDAGYAAAVATYGAAEVLLRDAGDRG